MTQVSAYTGEAQFPCEASHRQLGLGGEALLRSRESARFRTRAASALWVLAPA